MTSRACGNPDARILKFFMEQVVIILSISAKECVDEQAVTCTCLCCSHKKQVFSR